jgi:hypothetical protein
MEESSALTGTFLSLSSKTFEIKIIGPHGELAIGQRVQE